MPIISVGFAEGTESGGLDFNVSLDETSLAPVQVSYRVISDTAFEGFDLSTIEGTLIIPAGSSSETITIDPFNGTTENDENFTLELFDPLNAEFAGTANTIRATGVILDGSNVSLFVSDPVLVEGDDGTTDAVFEVRLSNGSSSALTFNYTTVDGTAEAGSDYTATSGSVTFSPNQQVAFISVPVNGDTEVEDTETFSLVVTPDISAAPVIANGTADSAGIAEIFDDDTGGALPTMSISDAENPEAGALQFVVSLDQPSAGPVSVSYRTISGTAFEGNDLSTTDSTLIIAAGSTSATISINPFNGTTEAEENFIVELYDPTNAVLAGGGNVLRATGVIIDTIAPSLFVSDPVILEGDNGQKDAVFEVRLSSPHNADLTFSYTTVDGTATAGSDYTATSGSLTILAGQQVAAIRVPVFGDTVGEISETFSLVLTPDISAAAVIGNGREDAAGIAEIVDDDTGGALPSLSVRSAENPETGALQFIVQLDQASAGPVQVSYRTISGTALEGADFSTTDSSITIDAGATSATITIDPFNGTTENEENFTLELYDPVNAVLSGGENVLRATGVIIDSVGPSLFVSDPVLHEGDDGAKEAVFEIRLSNPHNADLSFTYTTVDGTAEAGSDYIAESGSLTILAGQELATVRVKVNGDTSVEDSEFFSLVVSPDLAASAAIANGNQDGAGIAEIFDDDSGGALPTVSVSHTENPEVGALQFVLSLDEASDAPIEVFYRTSSGTALEGTDFSAVDSSVIIPAGSTTATITINPFNGTTEFDENFTLELYDVTNAEFAGRMPSIIVNGNVIDTAGVSLYSVPAQAYESDGEMLFTLILSQALDNDITVNYSTFGGTAISGTDFTATSGSVTFLAGQTMAVVSVPLRNNAAAEGDETFGLSFTVPAAITGSSDAGTATILDGTGPKSQGFAVYSALSQEGLEGIFAAFAGANNAAKAGEIIQIIDGDAIGSVGSVNVTKNNLTVDADGGFSANFEMSTGVRQLKLAGTSDMDVTGNGLANTITGAAGANAILGLGGNDSLVGNLGNDDVRGGVGGDTVIGGGGNDTLLGGAGADSIVGGDGNDEINTGFGNDTASGGNGADTINAGDGADSVLGGGGADSILGGDSFDFLSGGDGNDFIDGQRANDNINGGNGADTLKGFIGTDTINGGNGNDSIDGGAGNDQLLGGVGADTILGGDGGDDIQGQNNNDRIFAGLGADTVSGGNGADTIFGGTGGDRLLGEGGADSIDGGGGGDVIRGGFGNDNLDGGDQNDVLDGGANNDTMTGGAGTDVFEFREDDGSDVITDFTVTDDTLKLEESLWAGTLTASQVVSSFAVASGGDTTFTFNGGETLLLEGIADENTLISVIEFI